MELWKWYVVNYFEPVMLYYPTTGYHLVARQASYLLSNLL